MRAVTISQVGGPEQLEISDVVEPIAGPGQALVEVHFSGVNYIDVYHRTGLLARPTPFTLGLEGAGRIVSVGPGVDAERVGELVTWAPLPGSHADLFAGPADRLVPIPAGVTAELAAASMLQGMTAHYLANHAHPAKPSETAVVWAAAGGVGRLLTQILAAKGVDVIGVTSTEAKSVDVEAAGASNTIAHRDMDVVAEVHRITSGAGADVVYDSVGQATFERSLHALRPRGRLVAYGEASGPLEPFDPRVLADHGGIHFTKPMLAHYTADPNEYHARAHDVLAGLADGSLEQRIAARYDLEEVADAHRAIEHGDSGGKHLLLHLGLP